MSNLELYLISIAVFICIQAIAALGFNLQFGHAGIVNLGFIVLVAVGAYGTSIAAVGPAPNDGVTQYVGGFGWAFPWDVLFGIACALLFSLLLGLVALRRLRHDYLALCLVAILQGLLILVNNNPRFLNGATGVANVPGPWADSLSIGDYQLVFLAITVAALVGTYLFINRLTSAPLGRAWKAIREDDEVVASLARNPWRLKMAAFLVGGAAAGLSGSLLALYATGWSTTAWQPDEALALLSAVIIGGRGRNLGAIVGTVVVVGGIVQGTAFIPQIGSVALLPQLQSMALGLILLIFLWFRPEGILPERKEKFALPGEMRRLEREEDQAVASVKA